MEESRSDASARQGTLRDDLLKVIGRTGVRQLPGLGKARVQAGGICRSSCMGASRELVAVCDYDASYTAPNPPIWHEGSPVWWHLTNVRLLAKPIPCRGNVGMWQLPDVIASRMDI